LSRWT